jgi:hypothetical protein
MGPVGFEPTTERIMALFQTGKEIILYFRMFMGIEYFYNHSNTSGVKISSLTDTINLFQKFHNLANRYIF